MIFEKVAQNSLMQQNGLSIAVKEEKDRMIRDHEKRIEDLSNKLREKNDIESSNVEALTNNKELQSLKQKLSVANIQISTLKSQL